MLRHAGTNVRSALTIVAHGRCNTVAGRLRMKPPWGLKILALALILSALAPGLSGQAGAQGVSVHVVSDGTARYPETETPGWETVGFDDSAWRFVVAPSNGRCGVPPPVPPGAPNNIWGENPQDFQTIFVRKTFTLASPAIVRIIAGADDDYDLFVNGALIGDNHDFFPSDDLYLGIALPAGANVVAMRAIDSSGGCQSVKFDVFTPPAPPVNDEFVHAIVIPGLDFTDASDTRGATISPADASGCGAAGTNVWYAFTPAENTVVRVSTAGSGYGAVVDVFTTAGDDRSLIACGFEQVDFTASAGTTYHIMVSAAAFGGDLVLAVRDLGPPFQTTLRVATVSFDRRTGAATIEGTVTCTQESEIGISGQLRQKTNRQLIIRGDFGTSVHCDGTAPWSVIVRSDLGAFGQGFAEVLASASGCGVASCDDDPKEVVLRTRARRR
jgi:hypothetical protein